jgi:predicted negative regulator of RcsB-dependent stress response
MSTLQSDEANILDAETINWRLIVYPILVVLILIFGGLGYYYYLQNQREDLETSARAAFVAAKTPEDFIKVADQYPGADQGTLALLSAADAAFTKRDFAGAITSYQRVIQASNTAPELRDTAQLGLASAQEANGKPDDAINAFLEVARRGAKSPFAPYAYSAAARLYDDRGDKDKERDILTEAASLDSDSPFVKQAQFKLKELNVPKIPAPAASAAPAVTPPASAPASASTPTPVPPPATPAQK